MSLFVGEKNKIWTHLHSFCVDMQNDIYKPIKRQNYTISLVFPNYFNQNQASMKKFGDI